MFAKFTAWLKSKNWTAHSLAIVGLTAAGLITGDPQVRNFILEIFKAHPTLGADIVILAGIIAKYSHSSSAAGKVAVAEEILASANPPSPAAVAAATVTPLPNLSSKVPLILAAMLLIPFATGCKGPTVTAPLAPGYVLPTEQTVGEVIAAAKGAVVQYESDVAAKTYTPTPAMRTAADAIQKALVIADPLAVAWHNQLTAAQATISVSCQSQPAGTCTAAVVQQRIGTAVPEPLALASAINTINLNLGAIPGAVK